MKGKRKKMALAAVVVLVTALGLCFVLNFFLQVAKDAVERVSENLAVEEVFEGAVFEQEFATRLDNLHDMEVFIAGGSKRLPDWGEVRFTLVEEESGREVVRTTVSQSEVEDEKMPVVFDEVLEGTRGKTYLLRMEVSSWPDEAPAYIKLAESGGIAVTLYGRRFSAVTTGVVCLVFLFVLVAAALAFYGVYLKKWPLPFGLAAVVIALGCAYVLTFPAGEGSDEIRHFYRAYHLSDVMLGWNVKDDGTLMMRKADHAYFMRNNMEESYIDRLYLVEYYEKLFQPVADQSVHAENIMDWAVIYETSENYKLMVLAYLPSAVAISFGRLLGLNLYALVLLGRLANLILFALTAAFAMYRLPVGKELLFAIILMPMTMHQAMAVGYDAMVIALAFLLTALCVRLTYGEKTEREAAGGAFWDLVLVAAATILLLPQKHFGLFPLALLPLMVLRKKGEEDRRVAMFGRGLLIAGALAAVAVLAVYHENVYRFLFVPHQVSCKEGIVPMELIQHPGTVLRLLVNTFLEVGDWLDWFLGEYTGGLGVAQKKTVLYVYLAILVLCVGKKKEEGQVIGPRGRAFLGMVSALTGLVAVGAMFYMETTVEDKLIRWVQGRYFIPGALAGLLALRGERFAVSERTMRAGLFLGVIWQVFVVVTVYAACG